VLITLSDTVKLLCGSLLQKLIIHELKGLLMNLRPLQDRVIVQRVDAETQTASGLIIPGNAAEKPDQGKILAVGNGKILEDGKVRPLDVKVGDRVLFGKYSGQTVKVDGEELLVMREEDIMAVVQQ
jgi:chaperonin GroES